jgi:Zn-dependent protease with chaperone function
MWSVARRAGASAARRAASASASTSSVPIRWCLLSPVSGLRRTTLRDVPDVARGFRILPAAHAAPLGAAAAAVGVRAAAGVAANAMKLRAARGAYASIFSDRARLRFRHLVFGGDATGSAARVALVASAGGTALYCLVEPVPVSGRRRLLLFGLDDEMAMGDVAAAELFAERAGAFLPPGDARVRRVAAVMWQLVNRLEPGDVETRESAETEASSSSDETFDPSVRRSRGFAKRQKKAHPLVDGARRWTVHVVDDASVDAYTVPGGHVFVHSGVLDLIGSHDDSALAFVLAHEMGHALCRHGAEKATLSVLSSVADAASWAAAVLAGADYFGGAFTAAALAGAESAVTLAVTLPHSRDMEREADLVGVRLMARACFDPNGAARAFRKIQNARSLDDAGVSRLEAYLSTHPLDDERVRNASVYARALEGRDAKKNKTSSNERREALCASFRDAVARSGLSTFFLLGASKSALPPNANSANRGAVAAPSDRWRARFIRDVDATIARSPRGVTGALGVASSRGKNKRAERGTRGAVDDGPRVVGSGPVGRFDRGGLVAVVSGTRSRGAKSDEDEPPAVKTVSLSRAWRGPVRRAREIASAPGRGARRTADGGPGGGAGDGDGGVGSEARRAAPGSGDAEAGETVLGGEGRLDRGARRAVRRVVSRTTRRRAEL